MPNHVVLDTSVIIKWFRQGEILAAQAIALRSAYLDGQLSISIPTLVAYELANVLRYKNDLSATQVQDAVQSLFDMGLEWLWPSSTVMRRTVAIARECDTTVYDAAFVAMCETLNATFITADEHLILRLQDFPFVRFLGDIDMEA